MLRKRGAPALIELIKRSPTQATESGGHLPPYASREVPRIPTTTGNLAETASWSAVARAQKPQAMFWGILASVLIILIVGVAWFANWSGRTQANLENAKRNTAPVNAPGSVGSQPAPARTGMPPALPGILDEPALPADSSPASTQTQVVGKIQPGWNYLVVATLPWAEAVETGQFLAKNGYPATVQPKNRVDPGSAEANNAPCEVVLLSGVGPGEFGSSRRERDALMTKVKGLGRSWRAANRKAPSDFADAFWKKF